MNLSIRLLNVIDLNLDVAKHPIFSISIKLTWWWQNGFGIYDRQASFKARCFNFISKYAAFGKWNRNQVDIY